MNMKVEGASGASIFFARAVPTTRESITPEPSTCSSLSLEAAVSTLRHC